MAATAKTAAMYDASRRRYDRLVSFGVEKMAPESMKYILSKLQEMQKWATNPVSQGDPDLPATQDELEAMREQYVMQLYRKLTPEIEKLEARVRAVTPRGMPEENLLAQTSSAIPFDIKKWTPWLLIGGAVLVGFFMFGRGTSQNPRRRRS